MRLWVDTHRTGAVELRELALLARRKQVEIVIHTQVYLEARRQQRVRSGAGFNERLFDDYLVAHKIVVYDSCFAIFVWSWTPPARPSPWLKPRALRTKSAPRAD